MKNLLNNLKYRLQRFMYGRYGNDDLNKFIIKVWLVVLLLQMILGRVSVALYLIFSILSWTILISLYFRMFSKNINARYLENQKFISKKNYYVKRWNDRKTHKYFDCPQCKTHLRVPKGAGKITIHCRNCDTSFERKA